MKKKMLAVLLTLCMVAGLAACGSVETGTSETAPAQEGTADADAKTGTTETKGNKIYVMTTTPDHGWTGQGAAYAAAFVEEINAGKHGDYTAYHYTASDGSTQNDQVDEILANGDAAGVMFWGCDDSAAAGQEALTAAGIPWISYDRIIESTMGNAVLNYSGNNWQSGAAVAYYLVKNGMTPDNTLVQFSGDTSTVSGWRTEGFKKFLLGEEDYNDAENNVTYTIEDINDGKAWTQEEVDKLYASNYFDYNCGWSNDNAKGYIESNLNAWIESAKSTGNAMFVFSMDDEMSMAFLEILNDSTFSDNVKADLEGLTVYMSAVGGMEEMYAVMRGEDANLSPIADKYFEGLMSVYYNPIMTQTAIQKMIDYLDGNWDYELGAEDYEPVFIVDSSNAGNYKGFIGR